MAQRLDLFNSNWMKFQAHLQLDEDEKLLDEKKRLSNFEKIFESVQSSYTALKETKKV